MELQLFTFSSDRIDPFLDLLASALKTSSPFKKVAIVLPNLSMKTPLIQQIAKRLFPRGLLGVEFVSWQQIFSPSLDPLQISLHFFSAIPAYREKEGLSPLSEEELAHFSHVAAKEAISLLWEGKEVEHPLLQLPFSLPLELPSRFSHIFLFGLPLLPDRVWHLFASLPLPVYRFEFAPSPLFVADLQRGDEAHPLLIALCRLAKQQGHRQDLFSEEEGSSLLHELQAEIRAGVKPEKEMEAASDGSILFFEAGSSKQYEVELIKEKILSLRSPLDQIAILVSDPDLYAPFFSASFGEEIPYTLFDIALGEKRNSAKAFLKLLSFLQTKAPEDLIEALPFTGEEKGKVARWIEMFGLKRDRNYPRFFDDVAHAILFLTEESIPLSDVPLFEKLEALYSGLMGVERKAVAEWGQFLEKIVADYLVFGEEEMAVKEALLSWAKRSEGKGEVVPFSFVKASWQEAISPLKGAIYDHRLSTVQIHAIAKGWFPPCDYLFLVGFGDELFPRKRGKPLFSSLPDQTAHLDQYHFLQAILTPKKGLYISYLSTEDGYMAPPASPVMLLQNHLKREELIVKKKGAAGRRASLVLPPFTPHEREEEQIVLLEDLDLLMKNPCRFFLEKGCKMALPRRSEDPLSPFVLKPWEKEQFLPPALFGKAALHQLKESKEREEEAKAFFSIQSELPLEFSYLHPLQVGDRLIVGKSRAQAKEGFLFRDDLTFGALLKAFPALLAYLSSGRGEKQLLSFKKKKSYSLSSIDPIEGWHNLFLYREEALKVLSPLHPALVDRKMMKDPLIDWLFLRGAMKLEGWEAIAERYFKMLWKFYEDL